MKTKILPHTFKAAMILLLFMVAFVQNSVAQVTVLYETVPLYPSSVAYNTNNNLIYSLKVSVTTTLDPVVIGGISFQTSGNYSHFDMQNPSFTVYKSTDPLYDAADSKIAEHGLSTGSGENLMLNFIAPQFLGSGTHYILITANVGIPPLNELPTEGGRKASVLSSNLLINGETNPVILNYLAFFGPPPIPVNQQSNVAGLASIGAMASGGGVIPTVPTAPVLVANYTFCGNANDTSPNANNGTVNEATLTSDRFGNANSAYSFDGVNDHIGTSALATNQTDNWTMSAWVKPNSLSHQGSILLNGFDDGGSGNGYSMIQSDGGSGSGNVLGGLNGGVAFYSSGGGFANTTDWYHVVMTRSGGVTKFYINGSQTASTSNSGVNAFNSNSTFRIGSQNGNRFFNGAIDDVKVYNSAMTSTQVQDAYSAESANMVLICGPIVCPPITVSIVNNTPNECDGTATFSAIGGMANYTFASLSGGTITGNSFTAKAGTYIIQATDANGCTGTVSVILINNDTVAPTFTNCPVDIIVTADANCTKIVNWNLPTATDNCTALIETIAGFTYRGSSSGKSYYFSNSGADFETAKANCITLGGNMLVINDATENAYINSIAGGDLVLLGITDAVTEGIWLDVFGQPVTYFGWNPGEPNNAGNEDYATTNGGGWNDQSNNTGQYILEKGVPVTQTAGPASGTSFSIGTTPISFLATDAAGNVSTCSFTVTINPSVTADISYTSTAFCTNSGEKEVTIIGAQNGTFSIAPSTGLTINSETGLINTLNATTGNYTITYTIAASGICPAITDVFAITINAAPVISCPLPMEVCKNEAVFNLPNIPEGATVTVGGVANTTGTFDPSANWSAFNDGDANASVPIVYTLTNSNSCTSICSFTILVKRLPNSISTIIPTIGGATAGQTISVCKNADAITVLFVGGTGSMAPITFTYTLNGAPQADIVTGSSQAGLNVITTTAGTFVYHLTKVKINTGCEMAFDVTATVNILETPTAPSASPTQPTCSDGTGSITVNITAAAYSFDDGATFQTENSKSGLNPGTYQVKIKDAIGCISEASTVVINQQPSTPDAPTNFSIAQPLCDAATGTVTITNPLTDHTYFIDGSLMVNNTAAASPGAHTLTVKNAANCQSAGTTVSLSDAPISPLAPDGGTVIHPTCLLSTGSISIEGITGVTYSYNGGSSYTGSNVSEQLPAGNYIVKIKSDIGGCESAGAAYTINPQLTSPDVPTLSQTPANCNSSTGSITVTAPIGTDLMYKLDEGTYQPGLTFNNVSTGSHNVTVKNAAGCTAFGTIQVGSDMQAPTVTVPESINICKDATPITLSGAMPEGGAYSGTGVINGVFTPSTTGSFTITYTVTGSNGCVGSNAFSINVTPKFSVVVQPTAGSFTVCEGTPMAGFQFFAGGASSFSVNYKLGEEGAIQTASTTGGIAGVDLSSLLPGVYTFYFLDAFDNGNCPSGPFGSLTFTVKAKPEITCPLPMQALTTDPIIVLGSTGTYAGTGVSLNNTTGNYQFNPATAGVDVHEISYTIVVSNECSATCTFSITVTGVAECTASASISYPAGPHCTALAGISVNRTGTVGGTYSAEPNTLPIDVNTGFIDPSAAVGDYVITYTLAATTTCPTVSTSASISILAIPTATNINAEDFCQPGNATINFTGLVPGENMITVGIKTVSGATWAPQTLTVTAAPDGTGTGEFVMAGFGTELFEISIQKIVLGTCEKTFTGITDTFTKKPKGGGTAVSFTNSTVCMAANLSATITGVQNANYAQEVTYKFINLADNSESASTILTVPAGTANTLLLNVAAPSAAGNYLLVITGMYIADCGTGTNLFNNFTVSSDPVVGTPTVVQPSCANQMGTISIAATAGFMYSFDGGESFGTSNSSESLAADSYIVLVKNASGCKSESIEIELVEARDCGTDLICTTTQNGYATLSTICAEEGTALSISTLITNALGSTGKVFGLPSNNRTFTISATDLSSNIVYMLSGTSTASSKFGLGGASYSVSSTWPRVPLTSTGKLANNLFAHSLALYFNLQNSTKLDNVALTSPILNTENTVECGSSVGNGVISSYQLPTTVVTFLNNLANGYPATVSGLFQLNNDALGGKAGLPNLSTLAAAADKVNKAFNGCRLIVGQPANTQTFGTNIRVMEGINGFNAPDKGGLYMTLIEGDPATGPILGVVEVANDGASGFAPVITNSYNVVMGTDPEGSRIPQAPAGYRIVSQIVNTNEASFAGTGTFEGTGQVSIGNYNPQAGARVAAGEGYQIVFTLEAIAGPLPVRLVSFSGKSTEKGNLLNWKTSSEVNFSHFEVERSGDAKTFEKIGTVKGNKAEAYELLDNSQLITHHSSLNYYRLRMVDLDGKTNFSKTIAIENKNKFNVMVYPNPATEFVFVENLNNNQLKIRLLDALGREAVGQIESQESLIKIPTKGTASGIYFMQINSEGGLQYKKIAIQK